jgi:peptide/nickel transport system substrate-binding protein
MTRLAGFLVGAAACGVVALAVPAAAGAPDDVFVMAKEIDDVITLDPAEVFEFSGAEYAANVYERLVYFDLEDVERLEGGAAESWTVSEDGRTFTFRIRKGMTFHSGNPVTAFDAAYSLQRVVLLNKSPAFILAQFGFDPENVREKIRALDARTLVVETDRAYAPSFFLACLTAGVGSVVDRKLLQAHARGGDMGHGWLRTRSAGSGPFQLRLWKPNEIIILDQFDRYWRGPPAMARVVIRHIAEPGTQRLLIETGDIDVARNLGPDQVAGMRGNPNLKVRYARKGALYYLGLNQKNPYLRRPEVRRALKYLVDYDGIAETILRGNAVVHQSFLPKGFLGAIDDRPYRLDVDTARRLLDEAGLREGFAVTVDTRNTRPALDIAQSIQASFALAGIRLEILPGDGKQVLTKYRARNHDIYFGRWGPDYQDPHTNASAFASNPDNSDGAEVKTLAWRNGWEAPVLNGLTGAAVLERDPARRAELYAEIQRRHRQDSPFVILFQEVELAVERGRLSGLVLGPSFDSNFYRTVTKN